MSPGGTVDTLVHREAGPLREGLVADIARRRPLVQMDLPVPIQVARVHETFLAGLAAVGALPGMVPPVYGQVRRVHEPLLADFARKRPDPGMGPLVDVQRSELPVGLSASVAAVPFLVGVGVHVAHEVTGVDESLSADGAPVRFHAGVDSLVDVQVAGLREGFSARRACVRFDAAVEQRVAGQAARVAEGLAAYVALERRHVLGTTRSGSATPDSLRCFRVAFGNVGTSNSCRPARASRHLLAHVAQKLCHGIARCDAVIFAVGHDATCISIRHVIPVSGANIATNGHNRVRVMHRTTGSRQLVIHCLQRKHK